MTSLLLLVAQPVSLCLGLRRPWRPPQLKGLTIKVETHGQVGGQRRLIHRS